MSERNGARQTTAIEFGIALVSARSYPEKKLREKLAARYDAAEVEAALARLRELRLVDDAAWAERFTRDRFERVGKGRFRIRNELVARGIDAATADASLEAVLGGQVGGEAERDKAAAMLETMRLRRNADGEPENLKNRLFRRMLARGFPASLVRDLLDVS